MNKWTKKERRNGKKKKLELDEEMNERTQRQTDGEMNKRTNRTDALTYEQTARHMEERNERMGTKLTGFWLDQMKDKRSTMDGCKNPSD